MIQVDVPIIPNKFTNRLPDRSFNLCAANGSIIYTYGSWKLVLNFGFARKIEGTFMIADTSHPIIGADFFKSNNLLPDLAKGVLIDGKTLLSTKGEIRLCTAHSTHLVSNADELYPDIREVFFAILG